MSASALINNRFLARAQPEGLGSTLWTRVGNDVSLVDSANNVIIGAGTVVGAERFRVVGDVRIEGKLTVTGSIDPTDVQLSGGTELFFGSQDGSTAPISAAGEGRLRYNDTETRWEASVDGGAYAALGGGGATEYEQSFLGLVQNTDTPLQMTSIVLPPNVACVIEFFTLAQNQTSNTKSQAYHQAAYRTDGAGVLTWVATNNSLNFNGCGFVSVITTPPGNFPTVRYFVNNVAGLVNVTIQAVVRFSDGG